MLSSSLRSKSGHGGLVALASALSSTTSSSSSSSPSSSSSSSSSCVCPLSMAFGPLITAAPLHPSRPLLRPQTVKPNPFSTQGGNFDKSFEKTVGSLEDKMPFRQRHLAKGYIYDRNIGEETMDQMREAARQDVEGREPESKAAQQARSYFTDEDLSPEALHVRSTNLKVAQHIQRQRYDKRILKESDEAPEYYYSQQTLREKRSAAGKKWGCLGVGLGLTYLGWRRLAACMREGYDPFVVDGAGHAARVHRA